MILALAHINIKISEKAINYSFVNTVESKKAKYPRWQVARADNAISFNKETDYLHPQCYDNNNTMIY